MEIALRAAGIGSGDEVILAAFDYPGNFRSIELVGAQPVLVDVAPGRVTLDPAGFEAAASDRVRAVIVSHLFGQAAPMDEIGAACGARGWVLIEDACQVPGMQIGGRPAGSFGDLATVSFGGSKLLTAGSGGALLTRDERIAARLGPWIDRPSDAFPLSPLQASVLLPQIERLAEMNRRRAETVRFLLQGWGEHLPRWQPLHEGSENQPLNQPGPSHGEREFPRHGIPAHYKLAWLADSAEDRKRVVNEANSLHLPVGPGFRSTGRVSPRRCRKPLPLPQSTLLGDQLCLLDQTALLVQPDRHNALLEWLARLHDLR